MWNSFNKLSWIEKNRNTLPINQIIYRDKKKTISYELINKAQLKKYLETKNRRELVIIITFGNEADISKLCAIMLRFEKTSKVIEKYWQADLNSLYISYVGIEHN